MKEKKPSVIMFKGRVIMLKIGFTIRNNNERIIPPTRYVVNPPEIFNPVTICDVKKRPNEYKTIRFAIDFISVLDASKYNSSCQRKSHILQLTYNKCIMSQYEYHSMP